MNRTDAADPHTADVARLRELASWPDAAPSLRRYAEAKIDRYHRECDLGWEPNVAWARAEQMTKGYLEQS